MTLTKNQFYYEINGIIERVEVVGGDRVKNIKFFDNGIEKRSFAVETELFKSKKKAFKYYGHTLINLI
jgi:hypothetical protein